MRVARITVNTIVETLLAGLATALNPKWFGSKKGERPPLELVAVILGKLSSRGYVRVWDNWFVKP